MKKNILLISSIIVLVIAGSAYALLSNGNENMGSGTEISDASNPKSDEELDDYFDFDEENDFFEEPFDDKESDEFEEGEKEVDMKGTDQRIWEDNEPKFLQYKGNYYGLWSADNSFSTPLTVTVDRMAVSGEAMFTKIISDPATGIYGESTTTINILGTVDDDGKIQGIMNGTGITMGTRLGSTTTITGTVTGKIEGSIMTLSYNTVGTVNIPDFGSMQSVTEYGTITLKKDGIPGMTY